MAQHKIQIPSYGYTGLFQEQLVKFALRYRGTIEVHLSNLRALAIIAGDPKSADMGRGNKHTLCEFYKADPDFTLAVLRFVRWQWKKLDKSKAGRLKKFMVTSVVMKPADGQRMKWRDRAGNIPQAFLTDGQIATVYQQWAQSTYNEPGLVSIADVVKARKDVVLRIRRGEVFTKKHLSKDGCIRPRGGKF